MKTCLITNIFLLVLHSTSAHEVVYCYQGTQLVLGKNGGNDRCDPCPPGTFNDHKSHRENFCRKCSSFDVHDPLLELVANCTTHYDTVVRCRHREFYYSLDEKACKQCSVCEFQGQYLGMNCRDYEDTICCPQKDMAFWNGKCRTRTKCGVGEYLVPGGNDQQDICSSCPLGTTNYASKHQRNSCQDSCFDTKQRKDRHPFIDRLFTCRSGECAVGRSCGRREGLMCTRCQPKDDTPSNDHPLETSNGFSEHLSQDFIDEAEEMYFHIFLLVVSGAVVLVFVTIVSVYIIVTRWPYNRLSESEDFVCTPKDIAVQRRDSECLKSGKNGRLP